MSKAVEDELKDVDFIDHKIPLADLVARLNSNIEKGLTAEAVEQIQERDGPNALTPPPVTPEWVKFCKNLFGGFAILLWIGSVLCISTFIVDVFRGKHTYDNLYLGCVLILVVVITGCFQYYQEGKSSKIIESFRSMVPPLAVVRRDGEKSQIPAEQVVVGDIVEVKGGDRVPADIRIIEARSFKVDNSSLTGESEPQSRSPEFTSDNPLETRNLAFYSTNALEGVAVGIVIQIGDNTVMGKIAHLTSGLQRGKTPIAKEIDHFIHIITFVAFFVGILMFIISLFVGAELLDSIILLISMIVANVPEGLIATVCVCLTLTAKRMARQHCLVKNLEAVETLGSTSTICSDKTGTLTQNHMTVSHVWRNKRVEKIHMFSNIVGEAHNMLRFDDAETALIRICALCNRADFKPNQEEVHILNRKCVGDASEVALLQYAELQLGPTGNVAAYRQCNPKLAEIPFNSTNKFQVSVHDMAEDDKGFLVVMKGAPERILARCTTILVNGQEQPMTEEVRNEFNEANHYLGSKGERVLGFCDMHLDRTKFPIGFKFHSEDPNFPLEGLRFVGLVSMIDPPREGVARSVLLCQQAGIRVVMVTGDHPVTAQAIATKVHIIQYGSKVAKLVESSQSFKSIEAARADENIRAIVVHGEQLAKLTPKQQDFIVTNFDQVVFSRTSPAQKLSIVESYQRVGNIVAVTGDGVNDAPALRKADIGIAMGIAGTEVSKQAADMILMNDNFASIVTGIEEGRIIFDNLKKSIAYTLTSNIPEISPFLFHVTLGIPLPMTVIGILCIDIGTDLVPGISLAYEEAESDIMKRPPRNAKYDKLVNWRMINFSYLQIGILQAFAAYATYFVVMADNGFYPRDLLFTRSDWNNRTVTINSHVLGPFNYDARMKLQTTCNSAFFFAIVVVQWVDLIISKTRKNSLLTQRLTNHVLNVGLVLTVVISVIIMYTPGLRDILKFSGLRLRWTLVAVPFAWLIFLYDETRRFFIRRNQNGIVAKFTYY